MYIVYIDSGTSNSRLYVVKNGEAIDKLFVKVGTKDSAISGSNEVLLKGLKAGYDTLLQKNKITDAEVESIWISGMVTNTFGIIEVEHVSTPIGSKKMYDERYIHNETRHFHRELHLIRGIKTAQPKEVVTMENVATMNNVRGEEIEAMGLIYLNVIRPDGEYIMISPGSHTHMLYIDNCEITDIISNFTGELAHAIRKETILGGELEKDDVELDEKYIMMGYELVKEYALSRALYIIHATKVFDTCEDAQRSAILSGVIASGLIDMLRKKYDQDWSKVEKAFILGGANHIKAYQVLCQNIIPELKVEIIETKEGESCALLGCLELLKNEKES